jgi:4-hydroxy-tetrahydrodipicolinate synthase
LIARKAGRTVPASSEEQAMKTSPVEVADLGRSVIAVPALARRPDLSLDEGENEWLLAHLRAGGVSSFMYGGNANLYHVGVSEFALLLDLLARLARPDDWMIPSVGSDFGKAIDQAAIARGFDFPTVMVLPHRFPAVPAGVATGLRRIADAYGKPIIAYVKDLDYIAAQDLGRLARDGVLAAVKYGVVLSDPAQDPYLDAVLEHVDRSLVISGIGERPVLVHWTKFGLRAFTSGSVCVAPALSTAILRALQAGDEATASRLRAAFMPLEDLRDAHSPIRVLHEAVRVAGIAESGPLQPLFANIDDPAILADIAAAARALKQMNDGHLARAA